MSCMEQRLGMLAEDLERGDASCSKYSGGFPIMGNECVNANANLKSIILFSLRSL